MSADIFCSLNSALSPYSAVFILHFTPSLHFTLSVLSAFYPQSAFYTWSAVCSPQSAIRSLPFTLTVIAFGMAAKVTL